MKHRTRKTVKFGEEINRTNIEKTVIECGDGNKVRLITYDITREYDLILDSIEANIEYVERYVDKVFGLLIRIK